MSEKMEEGMEKIKVLNFKEWMHREDYGDPRQLERAFNQGMKYMGQIVEDEYIKAGGDSALQHINSHKWEVEQLESRLASLESDLRQAKAERDRLQAHADMVSALPETHNRIVMAVAEKVKAECAKVAALNYKHCRGGGLHIVDIDTAAIVAAVMEKGEGE